MPYFGLAGKVPPELGATFSNLFAPGSDWITQSAGAMAEGRNSGWSQVHIGVDSYDQGLRVTRSSDDVADRPPSRAKGELRPRAFDFFDLCHAEARPPLANTVTEPRASPSDTAATRTSPPPENLDQLLDVARSVEGHTEPGLLLGPDNEQVPLPAEVYRVLRQVVDVMGQGKATLVAPQGLLLTTQEAADFLGVSRPTLVKLLEDGAIAFEKPNQHRRSASRTSPTSSKAVGRSAEPP